MTLGELRQALHKQLDAILDKSGLEEDESVLDSPHGLSFEFSVPHVSMPVQTETGTQETFAVTGARLLVEIAHPAQDRRTT